MAISWRSLLKEIIHNVENLDEEAKIKIIYRDEGNCATHCDEAPVQRVGFPNHISVEVCELVRKPIY